MNKLEAKELLQISDKMVMKSLLIMYSKQNADEQAAHMTSELNGVGFNGVDAGFLSDLAEQVQKFGSLSPKQMQAARKALIKYSGQIADAFTLGIDPELPEAVERQPKKVQAPVVDSTTYKRANKNDKVIEIKLDQSDVDTREVLKDMKFKFDGFKKHWTAPDNAVNRVFAGMELPCGYIPPVDFNKFPMLRDYQKSDIEYMLAMENVLNANEMGLGKTLEAIVYIDNMPNNHVLVVCPKTLIGNWKKELIKWHIATEDEITCIEGNANQKAKAVANLKRFVVTNYDSIRDKAGNYILEALLQVEWDVIVADEAHRMKNKDAQQSKGMQELKKHSSHRLALTGTPVQNKPNDLWHILNWLDVFYSGRGYWNFVNAFCEVEDNGYGFNVVGLTKNKDNQQKLNSMLQHFMVRNAKKDVLKDLPDKIFQTINVSMTAKQAKMYNTLSKEILAKLEESETEIMIQNALTRLLRLQQVTSNPAIFEIDDNPKFDAAMELLEGATGKVVFFSRFNETIRAFEKRLQKEGIKSVKITGDVKEGRQEVVDKFQTDDSIQVFLGTIKAAGEGLTLTAADTVVFFDREWSPAMNDQATDRVHRIGQTKGVHVVDIKIEGTIDEWVEEVLSKKISDIKKLIV